MRKAHKYVFTCDAGGTLRCSSGKTNAIAFSAVQPHRLEVLKAVLKTFVAEEQALGDVGPNRVLRGFKTACTRIEVRTPGLRTRDRGPDLLVPLPRPFGICLNAADGPMNARAGGIYSADGNAHTPDSTGRLDSVSSTDSSLALLLLLGAMMLPVSSRSLRILTSASASGLLAEEGCHPRIWP